MRVLCYTVLIGLFLGGIAFAEDIKIYTISDLYKSYKSISKDVIIRVKFYNIDSIEEDAAGKSYWINISDDDQNVSGVVGGEGRDYFSRMDKLQQRKRKIGNDSRGQTRYVYCTVSTENLKNKVGGTFTGPVIYCLGVNLAADGKPCW